MRSRASAASTAVARTCATASTCWSVRSYPLIATSAINPSIPRIPSDALRVRLIVGEQELRSFLAARPAQNGKARPILFEASSIVVQRDAHDGRQQHAIEARVADQDAG